MDERTFRDAMGKFATGITVVLAEIDGQIHGMTVNAFMSVSLHPMLVMVSIDEKAMMYEKIIDANHFSICFLREDQQDYSMIFANQKQPDHPIQFDRFDGQPILKNPLAAITCSKYELKQAGDHMLVLGEVKNILINEGKPLLYYQGQYKKITE
ncbi:flavin reductase family protein [Heyndrickxia oleronia]|jgi:flavin reductase (DIM6/NTAB) family NADH-FMN oxidoreductase RutF|uniref:flavin reductase family protein n=1 Tax=Heyndrickxia oleronia TaxID=38875 RepID=UPI00217E18E1|nr:flavin reductase family protein [Heyndrickxia oleronia]MCI1590716.1 flavin reductase family protein [Heyndrickxia oleronia]MCI1612095.1 flavin reductase family protein [Heyndrickxia oleronia]MCI1759804.1 flavin reductase family protein [Heyndrickxia oleronia]